MTTGHSGASLSTSGQFVGTRLIHGPVSDGQNRDGLFTLSNLIDGTVDVGLVAVKQVTQLPSGSSCLRRNRATPGKELEVIDSFFETVEPAGSRIGLRCVNMYVKIAEVAFGTIR